MTATILTWAGHALNVPGELLAALATQLGSRELLALALALKQPAWCCYMLASHLRGD